MAFQQVYLDHLLLQFSQEQFETLPTWITDNFTVIDGGVHTGGISRNKLIIFHDGTYLELYNWITKPKDWRAQLPGDFALTTLEPITAESSQERIANALATTPGDGGVGVTYLPPREGGRKNAEGIDVRWEIVKPGYTKTDGTPGDGFYPRGRTDAPFFCHDITPRTRRVTYDLNSVTQHPSGATGIKHIEVLVPNGKLGSYSDVYASIVGAAPDESDGAVEFRLCAPGIHSFTGSLRVREAKTTGDEQFLREKGIGISSLVLRSETGQPISFSIADYLQ
ncbi:hypothetical protein BJY01DRAFT_208138 [Aspergillus pseudoustus]|uniref:Glyoxalase-like domain-containing protein n=1 Tax=Aspergillus pseudoustus TaxID=1810923 RepID=A0ABR4KJU1_9EURO